MPFLRVLLTGIYIVSGILQRVGIRKYIPKIPGNFFIIGIASVASISQRLRIGKRQLSPPLSVKGIQIPPEQLCRPMACPLHDFFRLGHTT